jgi:hypothetical protein
MWYSMVIQYPGQSMQEAVLHADQFICAFDSDVHGKRQAKKLARQAGRDYIFRGPNVGQPRLVKTPVHPTLGTAPESAIRSRDRQRGFYWVSPANIAQVAIDPPRFAYDRDVLGEREAKQRADQELAERQRHDRSAPLTIQGSDFLAEFYRPSSEEGVYELDREAAEPFLERNRAQLEELDPEDFAEIDRLMNQ